MKPGKSFTASPYMSQNASNNSWMSFFNPNASGYLVAVDELVVRQHDQTFSTSQSTFLSWCPSDMSSPVSSWSGLAHYNGDQDSVLVMKQRNNTTTSPCGTLTGLEIVAIEHYSAELLDTVLVNPEGEPLIIPENRGLVLYSSIDCKIMARIHYRLIKKP